MEGLQAVTVTADELAAGAADADLLTGETDGDGLDRPLLLVDLDSATSAPGAVAAARDSGRLLIGVADRAPVQPDANSLAEALDLTLCRTPDGDDTPRWAVAVTDPRATAERLLARVADAPQPALIMARLLRMGESLTVLQAIEAESLAYSTLLAGRAFARWRASRPRRPLPPPGGDDAVLLERDGARLRLTLNRPTRHNSHSAELRDALVSGLRLAELDPSIEELVLDGVGPSFCSGGDLDEFGTAPDPATAHFIRVRAGAARRLHALRDRLTVHLHGHCVGAGIELPAFAGRVLAGPDTSIRLPELELGLIPGAGGTASLPRRIGRWRTLHLFLSGAPISAEHALAWGLVDRLDS